MLRPIENGEYLDEKISKYSSIGDYEIKPSDAVAIYVESVSPANFIAKFQFADLCNSSKKIAMNNGIKYPVLIIREATAEDGNLYPNYDKLMQEKKFSMVVILGNCSDKDLQYLKDEDTAMDLDEVLPQAGVYRPLG